MGSLEVDCDTGLLRELGCIAAVSGRVWEGIVSSILEPTNMSTGGVESVM